MKTPPPKVGQTYTNARLGKCLIVKVYVFGTMDVMTADGHCYRITGLPF